MKICQLCAVDFTVDKFLLPLINKLEQNNFDVTIICSNGKISENLSQNGYKFINTPIHRSLNIINGFRTIISLYKIFKKEKFDLIHVHTPVASFLARIAAKLYGKSIVIYTAHGFYFHDEMNSWKKYFFIKLEKFACNYTDFLFCQSKEDADFAINNNFLEKNKVFTIGNGVDTEIFNPHLYNTEQARLDLGIPIDSFVLGFIGRRVQEKGIVEILDASITISKLIPNFYLLLIGEKLESDHNNSVDDKVNEAKLLMNDKLIDLGYRNDIAKLITVMNVFCLPSYREGFPRTILEAMMMNKPIIATNIRGSREAVKDGINGILIPTKNTVKLIDAILYFIKDENFGKIMGKKSYEFAHKFHNEENILNFQVNFIKKLLTQ